MHTTSVLGWLMGRATRKQERGSSSVRWPTQQRKWTTERSTSRFTTVRHTPHVYKSGHCGYGETAIRQPYAAAVSNARGDACDTKHWRVTKWLTHGVLHVSISWPDALSEPKLLPGKECICQRLCEGSYQGTLLCTLPRPPCPPKIFYCHSLERDGWYFVVTSV